MITVLPVASDEWAMTYRCRIKGGNFDDTQYEKFREWVRDHPGTFFDSARGVSFVNGRMYYAEVVFPTEADQLAFKLTFGNMVV